MLLVKTAISGKIRVIKDGSAPHFGQLLKNADIIVHGKAKAFIHFGRSAP